MAADHAPGSPRSIAEPGTQLGPYEIEAAIGSGGMGEVFRAIDTRLGRKVAIKILPRNQIADADRKQRFLQEARAASALNHSNIVTLHDIASDSGVDYLVMELVEGESLDQLMLHQRLPVSEALSYAHQIATGLAAAHAAGIVHRDIKPANVIVTAESQVKILDFGLAKLTERFAGKDGESGKRAAALTEVGTVLGTVAYMSPEQVAAKPLDSRTDIFSLGVMLQEMLTGVPPFRGASAVETMHAIVHDPAPPLDAHPPELQEIVDNALAKEPKDRYQHAGDLALDLQRFQKASKANALPSMRRGPAPLKRGMGSRVVAGIAALVTIAVGTLLGFEYRSVPVPVPELIRFEILPPDNMTWATPPQQAVSPDGRKLAFVAADAAGAWRLWVRPLGAAAARPLPDTEGAGLPFWSPDSAWIGFFAQGKLKKVAAAGGPSEVLADAPDGRGATWNREDVIVFVPELFGNGLSRVSASGGEPTRLPFAQGQGGLYPSFLPDGRRFLYWREGSVYVGALDSGDSHALSLNSSAAVYADPGYLLFVRGQGTLFAQRFDAAALALTGEPIRIADSLMGPAYTGRIFSVSRSGVLTYLSLVEEDEQFAWFDRTGRQIELVGAPGSFRGVDLSPDGSRVAVQRHDVRGDDIWVFEPRGTTTRLTFDGTQDNATPIWSPDGAEIAFGSHRNGRWGLYRKASNGTGAEELLVESDVVRNPTTWAPDGNSIVYHAAAPGNSADQWLLPLSGDRQPRPLLDSRFLEWHAQISPNGKWIAYGSNHNGGAFQVYVKPFPSGDGQWQVSTDGGYLPRWRADGKELFYLNASRLGRVMAVTVNDGGPTIEVEPPQELFDSGLKAPVPWHSYAVSPDGQRFLIPRPVSSFRNNGVPASAPISVVVNWTALLEADRP